jgi:hypothetical protein
MLNVEAPVVTIPRAIRWRLDRSAVRFVAHLAEMVVAMLVGMAAIDLAVSAGLSALGVANLHRDAPPLAILVMGLEMTVPMAVWMRIRAHRSRLILEMAAAMLLPSLGLAAASSVGLISGSAAIGFDHPVMLVAMVVAMLGRRAEYGTGLAHAVALERGPAAPAGVANVEDAIEQPSTATGQPAEDRWALRLGALAGLIGLPLQIVVSGLHPGAHDPNASAAVFLDYAASPTWTAIHIGQFFGTLLITLGLLAVARSVARRDGVGGTLALGAVVALVLVAAVFAIQMAVDGVMLREAIQKWIDATGTASKASAFDVAETVRWLEKGLSGFFHLANGTSLLLLGLAIATGGTFNRALGVAGVIAGLGFLGGGYETAHTGFSGQAGSFVSVALLPLLVFAIGTWISLLRRSRARG